jgi:hypothetical protein
VGGTDRERRRRDLVFDLLGDPADLREVLRHNREDLRPRRHWVAGDEATALVERTVGDGVGAGDEHLFLVVLALRHRHVGRVGVVLFEDGLVGVVEHRHIRLEHLLRHRVLHQALDDVGLDPGDGAGDRDARGVPHHFAAVFAGHRSEVDVVDVPPVLLDPLVEVRDVVGVEQPRVVDDDAALAEVSEVLRQRFDLLVAVVGVLLGVSGEGVAQREEEVVPVAARLDWVRRDPDLSVGVAAADA